MKSISIRNLQPGDLLLVYGSLRRGQAADLSQDDRTEFLGADRINGRLYDVSWFPGVKAEPSAAFNPSLPSVVGEVFELKDEAVGRRLDSYEGFPSLFSRIQTTTEEGRDVWVYVYESPVGDNQLVPSGDWQDVHSI